MIVKDLISEYNENMLYSQESIVLQKRTDYSIALEIGAKDNDLWEDWEEKVESYKQEMEK